MFKTEQEARLNLERTGLLKTGDQIFKKVLFIISLEIINHSCPEYLRQDSFNIKITFLSGPINSATTVNDCPDGALHKDAWPRGQELDEIQLCSH